MLILSVIQSIVALIFSKVWVKDWTQSNQTFETIKAFKRERERKKSYWYKVLILILKVNSNL
jgi:hypothetical protein